MWQRLGWGVSEEAPLPASVGHLVRDSSLKQVKEPPHSLLTQVSATGVQSVLSIGAHAVDQ